MTIVYHSTDYAKFIEVIKKELEKQFKGCKKIAIKIHFGEPGNKYALTPEQVKPITDLLKELNIDYFLFDSPVSYGGPRGNEKSHKEAAIEKGWQELGEIRISNEFIEVKGKNMRYQVCKELANADGVLVVSHVKGHVCSGFGGAIKNLGMGALTKKTKSDIHNGAKPEIIGECTLCGECKNACPINGIKVITKPMFIRCYGCSNCCYACKYGTIKPRVNFFDSLLAEGASTAQSKFKKVYYISFLMNITKECDCASNPGKLIAKDAGFLASSDGVAIDKASHDIIVKNEKEDIFLKYNKKTGLRQIEEAERFGMGSKQYKLLKI
ncbi:DUF362 domain-containing protein [Candidatus Pacearchaeota archaeon]|nr:DUF362 domain-containing protein [Candidatus Pacearchaeota archaeon]